MAEWYCGSTHWSAVTAWAASTAYSVGDLRRQSGTPTQGNERVFRCTTAGTSGGSQPSWTLTKGSTTNDNTCVWTEVTGNSTYGWSAAHKLLQNAASWTAAGDTIWVSHQHAQTHTGGGQITVSFPVLYPRVNVICVNDGAAPPTASAASATMTGSSVAGIRFVGNHYTYGIGFSTGLQFLPDTGDQIFDSCSFASTSSSASTPLAIQTETLVELRNVTLSHASTLPPAAWVSFEGSGSRFNWYDSPSALGGSGNTPDCFLNVAGYCLATIDGVDLSGFGTNPLIGSSLGFFCDVLFQRCKLGSATDSFSWSSGGRGVVRLYDSSSGDNHYLALSGCPNGSERTETTIVRTGGATNGTTPHSRKLTSSGYATFVHPLESEWIAYWNETVGSPVTITVEIVTDGVTLTDKEAWLEVEAKTVSGSTQSTYTDDRAATIMASASNQTSSSVSWTTTGLSSPVKQKLEVTVTPQEKGVIRARVCLAKISTTLYFDPLILADSGRQFFASTDAYINEAVEAGSAVTGSSILVNGGLVQ